MPLLALLRALPDSHRFFEMPVNERRQRVFADLCQALLGTNEFIYLD